MMLACNMWIHRRVRMEHVSKILYQNLLSDRCTSFVIMFELSSPADERTKLKVILF